VAEALDWSVISFRDNQPVIDLIAKKPQGLLIMLEEQVCVCGCMRAPRREAVLCTCTPLKSSQPNPNR
jgi:hypothetical protein